MVYGLWTLCGCAHVPRQAALPSPQPLPAEVAAYYDYPHHAIEATTRLVKTHRTYRESIVQFPLASAGFEPTEPTVEFEWFESAAPGKRAAILFNPILGGDYPLERGICRFLARHGFHVALVHRKTLKISPTQPVAHIELLLRQGIIRIRQVVDWMAANDRVDPHRMGSYGISMGGIATVITAAVEPRLRVHVVALAGGTIPDILATSTDGLLAKPRARYLARNGIDLPTLDRQLRAALRTDPVRLASYVDGGKLLTKPRSRYLAHHKIDIATMHRLLADGLRSDPIKLAPYVRNDRMLLIVALADRTIGRRNALRLRDALGKPETIFVPLGHYTTYLYLPAIKFQSLRYFRKHLPAAPRS